MVGIFSRFSVRGSHRRAQSLLDERVTLPPALDAPTSGSTGASASASASHGIEIAIEFKPVERPTEPVDNDQPIQCPFPEPSILNDGRIWKDRVSSGVERGAGADSPAVQEQTPRKPRPILPSVSAPEHNILKLLDECNSSGL